VEHSSVHPAELLTFNPVNDELRPQPFVMQSDAALVQPFMKTDSPLIQPFLN